MKKSKKPRPVVPCWYCGSHSLVRLDIFDITFCDANFGDVRDRGWWFCMDCMATAHENPTSLGPRPKIMPWGTSHPSLYGVRSKSK